MDAPTVTSALSQVAERHEQAEKDDPCTVRIAFRSHDYVEIQLIDMVGPVTPRTPVIDEMAGILKAVDAEEDLVFICIDDISYIHSGY